MSSNSFAMFTAMNWDKIAEDIWDKIARISDQ